MSTTTSSRTTWSASTSASNGRRRPTRGPGKGEKTDGARTRRPRLAEDRRHQRALNPFTGEFYREALPMSRMTREMCLPDGGSARSPHFHAYPGGVGTVATIQLMTDYMSRLMRLRGVHEEGRADA